MNLHPKVRVAAQVAAVLVAIDALLLALQPGASPLVLSVIAAVHAVLPVAAGYLKRI